ncbi:MAG: hypothetical protein ACRC4M_05780 [Mycoplasma sp.]
MTLIENLNRTIKIQNDFLNKVELNYIDQLLLGYHNLNKLSEKENEEFLENELLFNVINEHKENLISRLKKSIQLQTQIINEVKAKITFPTIEIKNTFLEKLWTFVEFEQNNNLEIEVIIKNDLKINELKMLKEIFDSYKTKINFNFEVSLNKYIQELTKDKTIDFSKPILTFNDLKEWEDFETKIKIEKEKLEIIWDNLSIEEREKRIEEIDSSLTLKKSIDNVNFEYFLKNKKIKKYKTKNPSLK